MSLKTRKAACPNHLLRQERQRRNWTLEEVASELHLLCEEDARTARGEINAKMIGSWERGEHAPSLYYRRKLCLLFGRSAEELGFVEPSQLLEPHSAALLEIPRGTPVQSTYHQTMDMHNASDAPYASLEQQNTAYLTGGASELALLVEAGWSVDDILDSLRIILPGVQAMQKITRRKVWELGVAAVMSDIPIPPGKHVSAEERMNLAQALGNSIAAGWKLVQTTGADQLLVIGHAQLYLVQQSSSLLYPSIRPLLYSGVYRLIGAALHFQSRYDEAYQAHEKAYHTALEGADVWNMAQSRSWQAHGLKEQKRYAESLQATEAALKLISAQSSIESKRTRAHLLASSAECAALMGDAKEVQVRLNAAEDLLDHLSEPHEEFDWASWIQLTGTCALILEQDEMAVRELQRALEMLPPQWSLRYATVLIPLAIAYARMGEKCSCLETAEKVIQILKPLNSRNLNRQFVHYMQQELPTCFSDDVQIRTFVTDVQHQLTPQEPSTPTS